MISGSCVRLSGMFSFPHKYPIPKPSPVFLVIPVTIHLLKTSTMKKLTLITTLVTALFLSSSLLCPANVSSNLRSLTRTSLQAYALFEHGGYFIGQCSLPNYTPYVTDMNDAYLGPIECPNSTATIDVVEGQQVRFITRIYYLGRIQYIYSPYFTVTATDIANGYMYLWASI